MACAKGSSPHRKATAAESHSFEDMPPTPGEYNAERLALFPVGVNSPLNLGDGCA